MIEITRRSESAAVEPTDDAREIDVNGHRALLGLQWGEMACVVWSTGDGLATSVCSNGAERVSDEELLRVVRSLP